MKKTSSWRGKLFLLAMAGCVQFLVLSAVAMPLYPGGNYSDNSTAGYEFHRNFFSDLGRTVAHNGDSNTVSMVLFIIGLSLAGLALIIYSLVVMIFLLFEPRGINRQFGLFKTYYRILPFAY